VGHYGEEDFGVFTDRAYLIEVTIGESGADKRHD
jgi:hypothetical protein